MKGRRSRSEMMHMMKLDDMLDNFLRKVVERVPFALQSFETGSALRKERT